MSQIALSVLQIGIVVKKVTFCTAKFVTYTQNVHTVDSAADAFPTGKERFVHGISERWKARRAADATASFFSRSGVVCLPSRLIGLSN